MAKIDSANTVNFIQIYSEHCGYGRYDYEKDIENSNYTFSITITLEEKVLYF